MFIESMQGIESIGGALPIGAAKTGGAKETQNLFHNIFQESISNVRETEAAVAADSLALASGDIDDLHNVGINLAKAQLSVSLLVQLRNGFLDAYNELMRISL